MPDGKQNKHLGDVPFDALAEVLLLGIATGLEVQEVRQHISPTAVFIRQHMELDQSSFDRVTLIIRRLLIWAFDKGFNHEMLPKRADALANAYNAFKFLLRPYTKAASHYNEEDRDHANGIADEIVIAIFAYFKTERSTSFLRGKGFADEVSDGLELTRQTLVMFWNWMKHLKDTPPWSLANNNVKEYDRYIEDRNLLIDWILMKSKEFQLNRMFDEKRLKTGSKIYLLALDYNRFIIKGYNRGAVLWFIRLMNIDGAGLLATVEFPSDLDRRHLLEAQFTRPTGNTAPRSRKYLSRFIAKIKGLGNTPSKGGKSIHED
jgi:hypothetical protein